MIISKKMTSVEEIEILNILQNYEVYDNGSSRACFFPTDQDRKTIIKLLGLPENSSFVIKLAMGLGGQTQMSREVAAYLNYGHNYNLAQIYAFGRFVEIMEQVELLDEAYREYDSYDPVSMYTTLYGYDEELNKDRLDEWGYYTALEFPIGANEDDVAYVNQAFDVMWSLEDLFGRTGDNGQIGISSIDGRIVCYDYGFIEGEGGWSSDLADYIYRPEVFDEYLSLCIDNIQASLEEIAALENALLCSINPDYYGNEEEDDYDYEEEQEDSFSL